MQKNVNVERVSKKACLRFFVFVFFFIRPWNAFLSLVGAGISSKILQGVGEKK